jgi:hypothetical protein
MMNKSLRADSPKSSSKRLYGFQRVRSRKKDAPKAHTKKRAAVSGGF